MNIQSVLIDATTQYGVLNSIPIMNGLKDFTLEFWFKRIASSNLFYRTMIGIDDGTNAFCRFTSENNTAGLNWRTIYSTTNADGFTSTQYMTTSWRHYCMTHTWSGDRKTRIYVDGTEIVYSQPHIFPRSGVGTIADSTDKNLYISRSLGNYGAFGHYTMIRAWNRALSQSEIDSNKSLFLRSSRENGLIVNCSFEEGSGDVVKNWVQENNDLILVGSPTWSTDVPSITEKTYSYKQNIIL